MKKLNVFTTSTLASALLITAPSSFAAGFQIAAQSATGVGRAYAGDGIIADNASVMAINPAAMALFDKTSFTMGAAGIRPNIEVKDGTYNSDLNGSNNLPVSYDDAGAWAVAPNMFLIVPLNDKWAVGAGMYSNFGTASEFDSSFPGEYGGTSSIISAELALAASYRVNDQWSFGAGLDIIYGHGEFKRSLDIDKDINISIDNPLPFHDDIQATLPISNTLNLADVDATGAGLGWNIGTTYELNENNRWGISYHASPEIHAKGKIDGPGGITLSDEIIVPLPDFAQFSGYNRFEGTKFAVSYTVQWTDWSKFDELATGSPNIRMNGPNISLQKFEWRDTWSYAIGGTYYLNDQWTLRAGYMFDQGAQDEITTVAVPDSNRNWLSAGFSYAPTKDSTIDFGFTYLLGVDVDTHEDHPGISSIDATTHTDAIITGVQYSKTF